VQDNEVPTEKGKRVKPRETEGLRQTLQLVSLFAWLRLRFM
jgi:hypothetical protein